MEVMALSISEARKKANKKWNDAHMKERYDRIQLVSPKGEGDTIKAAAAASGQSVNSYILSAVREKMDREAHTSPVNAQGGGVVSVPMESAGSDTEGVQKEREGVHE